MIQISPVCKVCSIPCIAVWAVPSYRQRISKNSCSWGKPQDAPAFFRLKFGEIAKEMTEDSADYDGWISRSWIQEEFIHIDVLPAELKLPRRYAFRYMEIEAIDTSMKWQMVVEDVF